MTLAEQIQNHASRLPDHAAQEVLDFIIDLESKLQRREGMNRGSVDWPEPIHVPGWDDAMDLRREVLYGDDGR